MSTNVRIASSMIYIDDITMKTARSSPSRHKTGRVPHQKTEKRRCPPYKKGGASLTDRRPLLLHVSRRRTPNSPRSIRSRHEYPVVVHRHSGLSKIHSRRSRHIRQL